MTHGNRYPFEPGSRQTIHVPSSGTHTGIYIGEDSLGYAVFEVRTQEKGAWGSVPQIAFHAITPRNIESIYPRKNDGKLGR
jgi:hypothetical protein